MLKKILLGLVGLVAVLLAIGFVLPSTYRVERSMEIAAPAEKLFPYFADTHEWKKWAVWNQRDPNMKIEYSGPQSGTGAKWSWQSKSEGNGQMELTRADAPGLVEYKLYFPDFNSTSSGKITLVPSGAGTKVSWSNEGDMGGNPLMHYMALMMEKMVGPDFESGLKNLKTIAEKT
jgi:uncharacterized protein YndB with AHSA1/START domain